MKLALALGAAFGWTPLVVGAMAVQVLAGVYALALLMFRKASRASAVRRPERRSFP
ncbi:type IV peptidase [Streptomyces venezuelae]|nr:type IV peptidase [Streptomyces venezuelae]CUM35648.1 hypothetical protein BN2537_261 [Streptomyces venezuelae]